MHFCIPNSDLDKATVTHLIFSFCRYVNEVKGDESLNALFFGWSLDRFSREQTEV